MSTWSDVIFATVYGLICFAAGYLNGRIDERQRRRRL